MKKLFPQNSRFKEFLSKKGFYVILALCIALVGIAAVFVAIYNFSSGQDLDLDKNLSEAFVKDLEEDFDADSTDEPVGELTAQSSISTDVASEKFESANNGDSVEKQTDSNSQVASATVQNQNNIKGIESENIRFVMPVYGSTILEFAMDKLVYSKTLEKWCTHEGVDIAAERGTAVKAVADGVVSEIKNDPRYGITIVIDHQNGLKTKYCNLANDEMVKPNLIVKQGDVIGCVGSTAAFESVEQSHLHFEVLMNNQPVDPILYLPKVSE